MQNRDCCRTTFRWSGTPVGHETKLKDYDTYVTGDNKDRAVLICHDALGWKFTNARLLADHYAQEANATVYMPDFLHGFPVPEDKIRWVRSGSTLEMERDESWDWAGFFEKNAIEVREPEVVECAQELRSKYAKLGVVGYCWGGSMAFKIANKKYAGLIDCVSIAHPGTPSEDDVKGLCVPVQIIAPEYDLTFTQEWKEFSLKEIPKLGLDFDWQYFPDMYHGFCTKCDDTRKEDRRALERAKNAVVFWFATHLK